MQILDIAALSLLILSIVKGLHDGFVKQVLSVVVLLLAYLSAQHYGAKLTLLLEQHIHLDPLPAMIVGHTLLFVIVLLGGHWVIRLISKTLSFSSLCLLNKLAGAILSGGATALLLGALTNAYQELANHFTLPYTIDGLTLLPILAQLFRTILFH